MAAHAILSASGSSKWMNCSGSILAESGMPEDEGSDFAREGTAAHELAEMCLISQRPPESYIGVEVEGWVVDEEMADHVSKYVDYCNMHTGKKYYELRVDYSRWAHGGFGTADCVAVFDGVLNIIDLKYGTGIKVSAQKNSQLMLYGLGALEMFGDEVDVVTMTIVQTRLDHIDTYSIRAKDLLKWAEDVVRPAAIATMSIDPEFNPSVTACRWCRAKPVCRALAKHNYNLTLSNFDNLEEPLLVQVPHTLTPDEISKLVPKMDALIGWARGVQQHAQRILFDGGILDGYKLVKGRSQRKWVNDKDAETHLIKLLGDQSRSSKLISPAQAEKLLGKARAAEVTELCFKPEGKPSLALDSDPRPAIKPDVATYFADIKE